MRTTVKSFRIRRFRKAPWSRHVRGSIDVAVASVICLASWITGESCSLLRERHARAILESEYRALCSPSENALSIRLLQLPHGRLYVPIDAVTLSRTNADENAFEQLASFRRLRRLTVQHCLIEPSTKLKVPAEVTALDLVETPIAVSHLRSISGLSRLESLRLDGVALEGNWLRHVSGLRRLRHLIVSDGELTDDSAHSLGRMKGLRSLQLSNLKITAALGPAIKALGELEALVIDDMPFDDEGMKHLSRLQNLRVLFLGGTAISDNGMANLKSLPNLWRLSLQNTNVGDEGLRHLTRLPKLAGLDIRDTRATNSCLRSLAGISSLKMVLVQHTRISESSAGFIGVLRDHAWYRDEASAKEMAE
jgi:hypothetical protein